MNNIVLDFRHNYVRGERLQAQELVYQYDTGRVLEAYVPETATTFLVHVGFVNDSALTEVTVDSVTEDTDEGGYIISATLPDTITAQSGSLLVYVVESESDATATMYEGQVTIKLRAPAAE